MFPLNVLLFESKLDGIMVTLRTNNYFNIFFIVEKSDPDLIFTLTVRNKTEIELFNTTQEHVWKLSFQIVYFRIFQIVLSHLSHKSRYIVHLTTLQRSKINKTVLLASNHSIPHEFMINGKIPFLIILYSFISDGCMLMSSICSTDSRCLPLTSGPASGQNSFYPFLYIQFI